MRRLSLSATLLLAVVTGPLSGCAHVGSGGWTASQSQKIEAKYDIARLAESDGQFDKARESYESIYKKQPSNAEVCHRLGIVHAKQSNFEAAKRYLNEAHDLNPSSAEILNDLGYACYLSGDLKMAENTFEKSLKVAPDNKRAANNLALVYGGQGRFDDSLRMFRQVNGEAEANSNVAYLYAQHGQGKQALEHYSKALSLKPELKNAANGMLEIASLQQKMESDRATLARQQNGSPAPVVAQVAAQAQPKVYPQLAAAQSAPKPVVNDEFVEQPEMEIVSRNATNPVETTPVAGDIKKVSSEPQTRTSNVTQNDVNDFEDLEGDVPVLQPVESTPVVQSVPRQVIPAPTPVATTPVSQNDFEAPVEEAPMAVITPSRPGQVLANVPDVKAQQPQLKQPAVQAAGDFVSLCPEATEKVLPLLVQLNTRDASKMKTSLHKLGEMAAEGASATPAIRAALTDGDAQVRIHAALALYRVEQNSNETVPVFLEGLRNTDPNVRSFAATAMALGPVANEFVAPLTTALGDANPFVCLHAAEALHKHPAQQELAEVAMIGHLDNKDANVRWLAIFIMGEALPKSPDAIQALTLALYDDDNRIRAGAAFALGGLGSQAKSALPELKELVKDENPEVRKSVEDAIREIEHNTAQVSRK